MHALSVGEAQTAGVLLRGLKENFPERPRVLTVSTTAGLAFAKEKLSSLAYVYPSPLECSFSLRAYLEALKPSLFLLIETDIWPAWLRSLKEAGIPALLLNAAISEKAFSRLRRWPFLSRKLYGEFQVITAASPEDQERLRKLPLETEVLYLGNLKYEFNPPAPEEIARLAEELKPYLNPPVLVAGSTHSGEEVLILRAFRRLSRGTLVVCPRHPERAPEILELARKEGLSASLRSRPGAGSVMVVDTLGELRALYGLSNLSIVGGTFVPIGGHNLLEPAALGKPVIFGPYVESVLSVARELEKEGGGLSVQPTEEELSKAIERILKEASERGLRARRVYERHRGALKKHLQLVEKFLYA